MTGRGGPLGLLDVVRRTGLSDPRSVGALTGAGAFWGASVATPYAANAMRHPQRIAIVDDFGELNYRQLDWRTSRVAGALGHRGVKRNSTVGLLCRNHRGFVEANIAVAKLGARIVYLNTGLPAAQLAEVIRREGISTVITDREFVARLDVRSRDLSVVLAAPDDDHSWSFPDLERWRIPLKVPQPWRSVDPVLLTSGTSGSPKGTNRTAGPKALSAALSFLQAVPFRRGSVFVIPAPLFHAWGASQIVMAATLAGTVVLRHTFDPYEVAQDVESNGADVLIAVPVMLHRILEAHPDCDMSTLRIVASSGSALPGDLALRWMNTYGDTLYNIYGSTEVGQVSVASPQHLRASPGTAGLPLRGIGLRIIDRNGHQSAPGLIGRIAVKSGNLFDGYTGGGSKEIVDDHMAVGDQGYLDVDGRLFVVGRADDMIISGGENVYPVNIERGLLGHESVAEAAVVGVPDEDLGHKVRAVIVAKGETASAHLTKKLKSHLAEQLAPYEMPREYVYVSYLPRNESGKILRNKLSGPIAALEQPPASDL